MNWLPWTKRKDRERDLDEEIEADFALEIQQRLEAGATREEAEIGAHRDFGNVSRTKEVTRCMWQWASLERIGRISDMLCECLPEHQALRRPS